MNDEIDLTEYNLIYHEIETGKIYPARRVCGSSFKFYDTDTGLKIDMPLSRVRKYFRGDESNIQMRKGNFRRCKTIFHYQ